MMREEKTNKMVLTALMMCLVMVATLSIRIPSPFTQGYVHLGDTMIFLSVLILGKKNGSIASGLGSALADIIGGYAIYAPWTLIIKALMAFVMATFIEIMIKREKHHVKLLGVPVIELVGMVIAGIVMAAGYAIVDGVLAGNFMSGILGIPANIGQFAVGTVLATILAAALYKTPAKKTFAYRIDEVKN